MDNLMISVQLADVAALAMVFRGIRHDFRS